MISLRGKSNDAVHAAPGHRRRLWPMLLALAVSGCDDTRERLLGSWVQVQGSRPETRLILREDGTGRLEVKDGINYQIDAWSMESDLNLRFLIFDQEVLSRFVVGQETLELSRVDGFDEANGTYRRETPEP